MTTNYSPIATQYRQSKRQPWRTHIEAWSLMRLATPVVGQRVIDFACGEGH